MTGHHDLCFGCGRANLFGLQLELERAGDDSARGRFFVKQDHQGPPGAAHPGILAAALADAMAVCAGTTSPPASLTLELGEPPPVGTFVELEAHVERRDSGLVEASGTADWEGGRVASARAVFAL